MGEMVFIGSFTGSIALASTFYLCHNGGFFIWDFFLHHVSSCVTDVRDAFFYTKTVSIAANGMGFCFLGP